MKLVAFAAVVIAAVYSDPGAPDLLRGYVLPALLVAGLVILFTVPGSLFLFAGAACFYYMDVSSPSLLESVVLPVLFGTSIVGFLVWAYRAGHLSGVSGAHGGSAGTGGGGDSGGC